jgi:hypothetical protein
MRSTLASDIAIHAALDMALSQYFSSASPGEAVAPAIERFLNESLQTLLLQTPNFRHFYPFPVQVRVLENSAGSVGWGFLTVGDSDALDWLFQSQPEEMSRHFPSDRWTRTSLPRVLRSELVAALSQIIDSEGLREKYKEDTLGVLLKTGVYRVLADGDLGTVSLARLLDREG